MKKILKALAVISLCLALVAMSLYVVKNGKSPQQLIAEKPISSNKDSQQTAATLANEATAALNSNSTVNIQLADNASTASNNAVEIDGNNITITSTGIYTITGNLSEGQILVDCDDTVVIALNNVEIKNSDEAAIHIANAKHTLIYLVENTTNILESGIAKEIVAKDADDSAEGAAIYSKDDLSIDGTGTLLINGYINNGIATTDNLYVLNGNITIKAINNGLKGKDSITINNGIIDIQSGNDGMKSNNDSDENSGYICINGGEINITSYSDGIQAESNLLINAGNITITTKGITSTNSNNNSNFGHGNFNDGGMGFGFWGNDNNMNGSQMPQNGEFPQNQRPDGKDKGNGRNPNGGFAPMDSTAPTNQFIPGFQNTSISNLQTTTESVSSSSAKGLKGGSSITIVNGNIVIDSTDDSVHSNGNITITGGSITASSKDDGIHADGILTIDGGKITINQSYEGIEGHLIYINDGQITVTASDDGINASGGNTSMFNRIMGSLDSSNSSLPVLKISGGTIYVNASGDGLDSNGDLIVEGGTIIIDGPSNSGNGALDSGTESGGSLVCNGGTIIAIGASGMAETFTSSSKQCSFIQNLSQTMPSGTQITIKDESGKTIFEHQSAKSFNSIVFSSKDLEIGKTYTVVAGNQTSTITLTDISNGSSNGFSSANGMGHGRH